MNKKQFILGLFLVSASISFADDSKDTSVVEYLADGTVHVWSNKKKYFLGGGVVALFLLTKGKSSRFKTWIFKEVRGDLSKLKDTCTSILAEVAWVRSDISALHRSSVAGKKEVLDVIAKQRNCIEQKILESERRQVDLINDRFDQLEKTIIERIDKSDSNCAFYTGDVLKHLKNYFKTS